MLTGSQIITRATLKAVTLTKRTVLIENFRSFCLLFQEKEVAYLKVFSPNSVLYCESVGSTVFGFVHI